ncbi:MAG: hypothetical protein WC242_04155 [Candidatus Paceibacterota bacterium]|jgi:hypothetical protein
MCPINADGIKVVAPASPVRDPRTNKAVAVEVVTKGEFERFNMPNYFRVGESGSITFGFGHFNQEGIGRDHQFKIVVEKPRETVDKLNQMVSDWFRLRSLARTSSGDEREEARTAFNELKSRFLGIIGQPAMAKLATPNLLILSPLESGTEVFASIVVYTTFESDDKIVDPMDEGVLLHGRFGENGHVIAVLITTDRTIPFTTPNGYTWKVPVDVPNGVPTVEATFPPDAGHEAPATSDGSESASDHAREEVPFLEEKDRHHRSGRKLAAVGATGRGKGTKRGLHPADVGAEDDG